MKKWSIIFSFIVLWSCSKEYKNFDDYRVLWLKPNNTSGETISYGERFNIFGDLAIIQWDYLTYCNDINNVIVAYDKTTGNKEWEVEMEERCGIMTEAENNIIFDQYFVKARFGHNTEKKVIEVSTGKVLLSEIVKDQIFYSSNYIQEQGKLYFVEDAEQLSISSYDPNSKIIKQILDLSKLIENNYFVGFNIHNGKNGMEFIIAYNNTVDETKSYLMRYDPFEGSIIWNTELGKSTDSGKTFIGISGVEIKDNRVYATAEELYCVDLETGELIWETKFGGIMNKHGGLFFHNDDLYTCSTFFGYNKVRKIDLRDGRALIEYDMVDSYESPLIYGNYLIGSTGDLKVFDLSSGTLLLTIKSEEIDSDFSLGFAQQIGVDPETGVIYANTFSHVMAIELKDL